MKLPSDHPQRFALNNEVHARPPEPVTAPSRMSYLALQADPAEQEAGWTALGVLCRRHGVEPPQASLPQFTADLGQLRVKWERHNEFIRFLFVTGDQPAHPFDRPAIALLPEDWAAGLPGRVIVAAHVALVTGEPGPVDAAAIGRDWFGGNVPVGSAVSGGTIVALTDCRIHADGFSRHLLLNHGASPWQAGRTAQRVLEIETYRVMALLAFPLARAAAPVLAVAERDLVAVTAELVHAESADEPALLNRLSRMEAELEHRICDTRFRFDASDAYYGLVRQRIEELRELRIEGLQTFSEFTERRLAPAILTCRTMASRQDALAERVARATRMLATRVELTRERHNNALLDSMNRRARLQLRLQTTVEGLLVAAVTYYVCGLVGHAAEALLIAGVHVRPELATGISIPIVGLVAWLGLHHVRRAVGRPGDLS
jgi:uncharacterized membrane-anchored protein